MSVTCSLREHTNWHALHCDHDQCRASFTVDYIYGHLGELRKIAAQDAGWTSAAGPEKTLAREKLDFCYRHSAARLQTGGTR